MDGDIINRMDELTGLRRRLVNEYQRGLPVSPQPFGEIAAELGWTEKAVLDALRELVDEGVVTRVGAVIRPNTIGVSALAAMAVPADRLDNVAAIVNARSEVNHNYEREHRFNLWFVMTAGGPRQLKAAVADIEEESGLPVMVLPMLDDYYIDLGFDLDGNTRLENDTVHADGARADTADIADADRRLLRAIQDGLPLVSRPYRQVAALAGLTEREVMHGLQRLLENGVIKRLGVIVRHHECGFRHNAMVVWDVPDDRVEVAGRQLAAIDSVRLCYRRPRRPPQWPYNLFCMIHGRDRGEVLEEIARIGSLSGLDELPGDVLFSVRRFKQRGARYDFDTPNGAMTA